ncbi:hypothetical protein TNCV_4760731 [Trichonephila clavipes]|uniref:Uncharacterized protein n=1 Tax=Trichonephila clavipes TaxID=2585209 RepID=A0A8X6V4U3_TRICX|nr:hypothetical protein TNCV_4760731 [Trichonephila clavipes]
MGCRQSSKLQRQFVDLPCLQETDLKGMWGCLRSTDSMAGEAVSLHSLLANRNCKIYRQNFEADNFPSGVVDPFKGGRANSRGFLNLLRLPEKPSTAGKLTCYPRSTSSIALSLFQKLSSIQLCVT